MNPSDLTISTQCPGLTSPVEIPMALLKRHMGMPALAEIDAGLSSTLRDVVNWYRIHGRPWSFARQVGIDRIETADESADPKSSGRVYLADGQVFTSNLIALGLARSGATRLAVMVASTGPEVDEEITRRWQDHKPDEAMCLNACAVAAIEHIRALQVQQLTQCAREKGETLVPRYSPGYEGWGLADQRPLMQALQASDSSFPGPMELTPGYQLLPTKSTTGIVGFVKGEPPVPISDTYWRDQLEAMSSIQVAETNGKTVALPTRLPQPPGYSIAPKALRKWALQRLTLNHLPGGQLKARFHYDGSTCSNMGVPLAFDFHILLNPGEKGGWSIDQLSCEPSADSDGYQSMCGYQAKPDQFLRRLERIRPLMGQPLSDVLNWPYPTSPSGCLCSRANQFHKWLLALYTLHYALEKKEASVSQGTQPS